MRNSDEDHCFDSVAFLFVCTQLKKDEPRLIPVPCIIRELKQRRRRRQRERQKSNRFTLEKQFHKTTTTFFFFSWTSLQSFRIQLQKAALIHFLSDVFVAVIVVLKLPIRIREIAELGRLLTKTPLKGALVRRRALMELLYLCQGLVKCRQFYEYFVFEWVVFHFLLFLCIFFLRASCYFSRGSRWGSNCDSSRLNSRAFDGLRLLSGNLVQKFK